MSWQRLICSKSELYWPQPSQRSRAVWSRTNREIVSSSVFQVASEFKSVSSDIRLIVKDAVSAVIENLQERWRHQRRDYCIYWGSWWRQSINKIQAEVNQLQNRIDTEEDELQQEIDRLLVDIEEEGKTDLLLPKPRLNLPSIHSKIVKKWH